MSYVQFTNQCNIVLRKVSNVSLLTMYTNMKTATEQTTKQKQQHIKNTENVQTPDRNLSSLNNQVYIITYYVYVYYVY